MKSLLQKALEKGLAGPLKSIPLAELLWKYVDTKYPIDINTLVTVIRSSKGTEVRLAEDEKEADDHRLRRILLRGIRKYPALENTYYSVDFSGKGECKSSVFLGANGIGKSSVYSAIEYGLLHQATSASARGYKKPEEQRDYMQHAHNAIKDSIIGIETHDAKMVIKLDESFKEDAISFPSFFCMNHDVEVISKGIESDFIAQQLGMLDFHTLLTWMADLIKEYMDFEHEIAEQTTAKRKIDFGKELNKIISEIGDPEKKARLHEYETITPEDYKFFDNEEPNPEVYKTLSLQLKFIYDILQDYISIKKPLEEIFGINIESILNDEDIQLPKLSSQIKNLKKAINFITHRIKRGLRKGAAGEMGNGKITDLELSVMELKFETSETDLKDKVKLYGIPAENFKNLKTVNEWLSKEYTSHIYELLKEAKIVFKGMFSNYFWNDIASVKLDIDGSMRNLDIKIMTINPVSGGRGQQVNPRRFLNTFRFKLYCMALKISLAFCCIKLYGINSPIVIDDVFDSSDFSNREQIRGFIRTLFETHEKIFHSEKPLQLIFFTQDDVIGDSVYKGILDFYPEEGVKYSRIFDLHEIDEQDERAETLPFLSIEGIADAQKFKVIRIEDRIK